MQTSSDQVIEIMSIQMSVTSDLLLDRLTSHIIKLYGDDITQIDANNLSRMVYQHVKHGVTYAPPLQASIVSVLESLTLNP